MFKYHVEARLRLWRLGDALVTRVFSREMDKRLAALRDAVASGEVLRRECPTKATRGSPSG